MNILHIGHIKWLRISGSYRFNLQNYGTIDSAESEVLDNSIGIELKSMSIRKFWDQFLVNTWFDTSDRANLMGLGDGRLETFAFCRADSNLNGELEIAFKSLLESFNLFGFSHITNGKEFLFNLANSDIYENGELIYSVGENSFYSNSERVTDHYINHLTKKRRNQFGVFLNLYLNNWKNAKSKSYMSIAFTHFLNSLGDIKLEEQVLHLVIALEALLSPHSNTELRHRVAQNASYIAGKNKKERYNIYYIVREAYDIRSKLAHGEFTIFNNDSYFKKINQNPRICIEYLRNIVRDIFIRCMILNRNKDSLLSTLKDDMLNLEKSINISSQITFFTHNW